MTHTLTCALGCDLTNDITNMAMLFILHCSLRIKCPKNVHTEVTLFLQPILLLFTVYLLWISHLWRPTYGHQLKGCDYFRVVKVVKVEANIFP